MYLLPKVRRLQNFKNIISHHIKLIVEEGDALNPVRFNAIPLPSVVLDTGADGSIDHVFRERTLKNRSIPVAYERAKVSERLAKAIATQPEAECKILEVICKNYEKRNEERYDYFVIDTANEEIIYYEQFVGAGSNPFICFRWSKAK